MKKFFYDNPNGDSNQYISEYFTYLESYRKIDFEDVCLVATRICENTIKEAINLGEMTVSGLRTSLESIHATDIEIIQYSDNAYEISLKVSYYPKDGDILTVPFMVYMTAEIQPDKSFSFLYGHSAFEITINDNTFLYDTALLHSYYCNHPERFNKNDFLNFTGINKE